uniref:Uncharacterized protein n=1 Tax=Anguilla anguilla TaxID=7936 RepID=A0A0E9RAY8_ANGAN
MHQHRRIRGDEARRRQQQIVIGIPFMSHQTPSDPLTAKPPIRSDRCRGSLNKPAIKRAYRFKFKKGYHLLI